ncbi:MAG: branched-chain amino acid ABC transporter permease [Oscillibacter sp.]|nr:branched-chain amino acid ABC transporter permease [Oscillibacter sp.]
MKQLVQNRRQKTILYGVLAFAVVLFPLVVDNSYLIRIVTTIFMYSVITVSLNLIGGYGGELAMGHAAYLAVAAYVTAILSTRYGMSFLVTFPISVIAATVFGFLTGFVCVGRIKGDYVMIITMGICEITRIVLVNEAEVTNGPMGISQIPGIQILGYTMKGNRQYYFVFLLLLLVTVWIIKNLVNSKFGRNVIAIREDETAARAMGMKVAWIKVSAFTISALFAGAAGALLAHYNRFIGPSQFNLDESLLYYQMLIIGGLGSIPGSIIGAAILVLIPEIFRGISVYRTIVYGLIMVIMMIVRPQGLLGDTGDKHPASRFGKAIKARFQKVQSREGDAQ